MTIEYNLIVNGLVTTSIGHSSTLAIKNELNSCKTIKNGAIAFSKNIIKVDRNSEVLKDYPITNAVNVIDAQGKLVVPGFVDSHTHVSFAGTREQELEWKLEGLSYKEIAARGGGILSTTKKTRDTPINQLISENHDYLNYMLLSGTTTIEAKSGYGLETATELKQLQVLESLNRIHPIDIYPTFLGAHAIPNNYDSESYTQLIIQEMIPAVKKQGIAKFIDVFCEEGYFSLEQTRQIVEAGLNYGLVPKIHVDEIKKNFHGSELAGQLKCLSADHLLQISAKGMESLARNKVIGTLLPGTPFVLRMKDYPPARKMILSEVPIAIATDFNPNCMLTSMLTVMTLASYQMGLKPIESLNAATIHGAWALGQASTIGSLEVGKKADIVVLDIPNIHFIAYYLGKNTTKYVIKNGEMVVKDGKIVNK
ncbi:MAG: imidazolonepropionase [Candidatus Thorarchaeota archaeon]